MKGRFARRGLVDFDDLVIFGDRLVADHDWVLPAIQARWPVLAVDEYQDLGLPLHQIVQRLAFVGGVRLFAVGDADQSVYGFAGADGALLLELGERPDVETVRLELNYRSAAGSSTPPNWHFSRRGAIGRAIPTASGGRLHRTGRRA